MTSADKRRLLEAREARARKLQAEEAAARERITRGEGTIDDWAYAAGSSDRYDSR